MMPAQAPARDRRRLYGLDVESELPLPCPPAGTGETDVTLHWLGHAPPLAAPFPAHVPSWVREDDHWVLHYHDADGNVLEFLVDPDGTSLSVRHCSEVDWPDILPTVLGPGLCVLLNVRGVPVLHGGSVVVEDRAVLLLGQGEAGKSTITAGMVAAGAPLLGEELAVLSVGDGEISVQPGHRLIKLSPASLTALGEDPDSLPAAYPCSSHTDQRWLDATKLAGGLHDAPARLGVVYLLAGRKQGLSVPEIEPVAPAEACLSLGRFLFDLRRTRPAADTMRLCALIAAATPVRRVWLREGLGSIGEDARALLADARAVAAGRRAAATAEARRGT